MLIIEVQQDVVWLKVRMDDTKAEQQGKGLTHTF